MNIELLKRFLNYLAVEKGLARNSLIRMSETCKSILII